MNTIKRLLAGDVLRIVAVLAVVINHFNVDFAVHGYLGVDAFFVLSGYVVLRSIFARPFDDSSAVWSFYARRFWRLYPPYLVTIVIIILLALATRSKPYLDELVIELISSSIYLSNIYFWKAFNYFSPDSAQSLSIHLWSLSVEEQYYLILPAVFLILKLCRPSINAALIFIAFSVSLALYYFGWYERSGIAAFYLLPFRAWQFILGGVFCYFAYRRCFSWFFLVSFLVLALGLYWHSTDAVWLRIVVSLAVAILLYADDWFRSESDTISRTRFGHVIRPMADATYVVYLFHQPFLVTAKRINILDEQSWLDLGLFILLLWLSAHLVTLVTASLIEKAKSRSLGFTAAVFGGSTLGIFGVCLALLQLPGSAFHTGEQLRLIEDRAINHSYLRSTAYSRGVCFLDVSQEVAVLISNECLTPSKTHKEKIVVVGDSEAAHLVPGLRKVSLSDGSFSGEIQFAASASCVPVSLGTNSRCQKFYSFIIQQAHSICEESGSFVLLFSVNWWGTIQRFGLDTASTDIHGFLSEIPACAKLALLGEAADFLLDPYLEALELGVGGPNLFIESHDKAAVRALIESLASATSSESITFMMGSHNGSQKFIDADNYLYFDRGHLSDYGSEKAAIEVWNALQSREVNKMTVSDTTDQVCNVLGVNVSRIPANEIANSIFASVPSRPQQLVCMNPHSYVSMQVDRTFSNVVARARWVIPDGIGICLAALLIKGVRVSRVTGSDLFIAVMRNANKNNRSVFFLGSTPEVLAEIEKRASVDFPGVRLVGSYSPPYVPEFSASHLDEMVDVLAVEPPDIIWIGVTSPKQDLIAYQLSKRLDFSFVAGIGAVFDFYAGNVRRANVLFRVLGLEWLIRLVKQPRKMWRRTIISGFLFCKDVVKAMLRLEAQRDDEGD